MAHIDTLKTFDKLVASGVAPEQARMHSDILNASFDHVATKDDLKMLEKDLKYFFINSFVGFIYAPVIVGIIIALILKWLGKF